MLGALPYLQVGEMRVELIKSLIIQDAWYKDLELKYELCPIKSTVFIYFCSIWHRVSCSLDYSETCYVAADEHEHHNFGF